MSLGHYTEETVKVSTDAKTTLPKQTRNYLDARVGDEIAFKIMEDGKVVVEKVEQDNER